MTHNQKIRQAEENFHRAAFEAEAAMTPFLDQMESDAGQIGLVMVSGVAACVQSGTAAPVDLEVAISKASEISGIPAHVVKAQAKFYSAMFHAFQLTQSN